MFNAMEGINAFNAGRNLRLAREQEQNNKQVGSAFATGDYNGAAEVAARSGDVNQALAIRQYVSGLDEQQRQRAAQEAQTVAQIAFAAKQLPPEQRQAFAVQMSQRRGIDPAEIAKMQDWSDGSMDAVVRASMSLSDQLGLKDVKTSEFGDQMVTTSTDKLTGAASVSPIASRGPTYAEQTGRMNSQADNAMAQRRLALDQQKLGLDRRKFRAELEAGQGPADFKDVQALRKEWNQVTGEFQDIQRSINNINTLGRNKDAASDLALIVAFTKLLDPGSVAREGEVALTQSSAAALAQAQNYIPRLRKGNTLLPDSTRTQLLSAANDLAGQYDGAFRKRQEEYGAISQRYFPNEPQGMVLTGANDPRVGNPDAEQDAEASQIPQITGDDEYNALPSGTVFVGPDGVERRKP